MNIELYADEVLALTFLSIGMDGILSFNDINNLFNIFKEELNKKDGSYCFTLHMPMRDNYDKNLFYEIENCNEKSRYKLLYKKNLESVKATFEILNNYLLSAAYESEFLLDVYKKGMIKYNSIKNKKDNIITFQKKEKKLKAKIKNFIFMKDK